MLLLDHDSYRLTFWGAASQSMWDISSMPPALEEHSLNHWIKGGPLIMIL